MLSNRFAFLSENHIFTTQITQTIMKISVENLGTIKKGEISLDKDLTIFTGENNSGKSYMSYLVYEILQTLQRNTSSYNNNLAFIVEQADANLIWGNFTNNKLKFSLYHLTGLIAQFENNLTKQIIGIFLGDIVNKAFNLEISETFLATTAISYLSIKEKLCEVIKNKYKYIKLQDEDTIFSNLILLQAEKLPNINEIKGLIISEIIEIIRSSFRLYFVPAERTAINMFYNDIVKQRALENEELRSGNNIVETLNKMQQQGKLLPRSPKPITDYIYFCYDFRNYVLKPPTEFADLATELENLLGGGVGVSGFGDLQFQPTKETNQIPLYLSSSLVKSWSGVVIYLRHLAQKGNILMIDEPEINLHPKSQVLIARFLAKMVNRGIKIVVSTHSDYILRELSTLIIANNEFEGKEKLLARYPEYQNQGLAAEKVGVYNFANHTIENVEITNKGIETASIDAVISRQNETSDAMYYTYLDSLPSEE